MPTCSRRLLAPGWLALACWTGACSGASGTPTPEPPDHLPRPEFTFIVTSVAERDASTAPLPPTTLRGQVGTNQDAWVVNLDAADAPQRVMADAEGAFAVEIRGARSGDRIRVVARTGVRHSLPYDLQIAGSPGGMVTFQQQSETPLACLSVSPADEITEVVDQASASRRAFLLENRCDGPVRITRAGLRVGGQGIALEPVPEVIPAGAEAELAIVLDGHALASERADVVLLEVAEGDKTGRYALGVYSVSSAGLGKP